MGAKSQYDHWTEAARFLEQYDYDDGRAYSRLYSADLLIREVALRKAEAKARRAAGWWRRVLGAISGSYN